jgi:hypothetical protein
VSPDHQQPRVACVRAENARGGAGDDLLLDRHRRVAGPDARELPMADPTTASRCGVEGDQAGAERPR